MKTKTIQIGSVEIPVADYAVSCNAILGIRDSGKTVTAKGIAEQLIENDIPIFVFDAVGKWRHMKQVGVGAMGRSYKVVVAGGREPDLHLSPQTVGEIVRSALRERIPLIIDLYSPHLSKAEWRSIVRQSIRIIHYEANGIAHVFLEEAAEFIPQKVMDGETFAEVEKLARMGGNASVGITIINQRSQEVNKSVLDLAHNLILGCQIGNKAIEAVGKWVDRLAPETAKAVTTSLPSLKSGEAWVWTRSNPGQPSREFMPMCRSLHPDRRTPAAVLKTAKAADVNEFVTRMREAIPKVIEEAKANDPAELRKRIAELERAKPTVKPTTTIKEVPALTPKQEKLLERAVKTFEAMKGAMEKGEQAAREIYKDLNSISAMLKAKQTISHIPPTQPSRETLRQLSRMTHPPLASVSRSDTGELNAGCIKILAVVDMLNRRGLTPNRDMIARWLDIHPNGGTYGTNLATLRNAGRLNGCELVATSDKPFQSLETGIEEAKKVLNGSERNIVECLQQHERAFTRDELATALGIHPNGGTYGTSLARLRTMGLIPASGPIKLTEAALR